MKELLSKATGLLPHDAAFSDCRILPKQQFFSLLYEQQTRIYSEEEIDRFCGRLLNSVTGVLIHCVEFGRSPGALLNGYIDDEFPEGQRQLLVDEACVKFSVLAPEFVEPAFYQEFRRFPPIIAYNYILEDFSGGCESRPVFLQGSHLPQIAYTRKILFASHDLQPLKCACGDCVAECCRALDRIQDEFPRLNFDQIYYLLLLEKQCACVLRGFLVHMKNYYDAHYFNFESYQELRQALAQDLRPYVESFILECGERVLLESDTVHEISAFLKQKCLVGWSKDAIYAEIRQRRPGVQFKLKCVATLRAGCKAIISECSLRCRCSCRRVVAADDQPKLFMRQDAKGFGLYAAEVICPNEYICCYAGETLPDDAEGPEALHADALRANYFFTISNNINDNDISVNAKRFGNVGRFINHSKKPNCGIVHVFIGDDSCSCFGKIGVPQLAIFSKRLLHAREEILIDYEYKPAYERVYPWSQK